MILNSSGTEVIAYQGSTFGPITVAFTDAAGTAVVPTSITWTLRDQFGNVINSRTAVTVAVPASSISIVLSGDDLTVSAGDACSTVIVSGVQWREVKRYLGVSAVYTSDEGTNLPLKEEVEFKVRDLVTV